MRRIINGGFGVYKILRVIDRGSYGKVYSAKVVEYKYDQAKEEGFKSQLSAGDRVAIKTIPTNDFKQEEFEACKKIQYEDGLNLVDYDLAEGNLPGHKLLIFERLGGPLYRLKASLSRRNTSITLAQVSKIGKKLI